MTRLTPPSWATNHQHPLGFTGGEPLPRRGGIDPKTNPLGRTHTHAHACSMHSPGEGETPRTHAMDVYKRNKSFFPHSGTKPSKFTM
eukprot:4503650-Amphidinium_carterae.1